MFWSNNYIHPYVTAHLIRGRKVKCSVVTSEENYKVGEFDVCYSTINQEPDKEPYDGIEFDETASRIMSYSYWEVNDAGYKKSFDMRDGNGKLDLRGSLIKNVFGKNEDGVQQGTNWLDPYTRFLRFEFTVINIA